MVIVQFVMAVTLIISALTAYKQMRFIQTHHTGYNRDEILVIPLNREARSGYASIRNELLMCPAVRDLTTSSHVPTRGTYHDPATFQGVEHSLTPAFYFVNKNFINTYGIKIQQGTDFTRESPSVLNGEYLISEHAVAEARYPSMRDALGKTIQWQNRSGEYRGIITGIISDMNLYSFHSTVYPIILIQTPIEQHNYLSIRLNAKQIDEALLVIRSVWKRRVPDYPLDYFFLDDAFNAMHHSDKRLSNFLRYFCMAAIGVACMGLFGLTVFTLKQKKKEISVRKVLGATSSSITIMLIKNFIKGILIANLIAYPLAYFLMRKWLQHYAYRTNLSIWIFILTGLSVLCIALLTVSFQTIKTVRTNPVESLRHE